MFRCHDEAFVIHADMKLSPVSTMGDAFGNTVTTKSDLAGLESLYR